MDPCDFSDDSEFSMVSEDKMSINTHQLHKLEESEEEKINNNCKEALAKVESPRNPKSFKNRLNFLKMKKAVFQDIDPELLLNKDSSSRSKPRVHSSAHKFFTVVKSLQKKREKLLNNLKDEKIL